MSLPYGNCSIGPRVGPSTPRGGKSVRRFAGALACGVAVCLGAPAHGVMIRADRDPAAYVALAASPAYAASGELDVRVQGESGPAVGSGTLVAPGWVLTAAHVMDNAYAARFVVGGQTYDVARWVDYPKYNGDVFRGYDLALVQLAQPITTVSPARLYRGHAEFGQTATFVGAGLTGNGLTGTSPAAAGTEDHIERAATNVIDASAKPARGVYKLTTKLKRADRLFVVDFDRADYSADSTTGSAVPTNLEGLITFGDSGGGVFLPDPAGGAPLLAGVHSYGEDFDGTDNSDYGDMTAHTRVSTFATWVDRTISGSIPRRLQFVTPDEPYSAGDLPDPLGAARRLDAPSDVSNVPEPTTLGLIFLPAAAVLARRRINH